jgi:hypothetical protein
MRIVIAAVLAATADAVLAAHHLSKLGAHLVTALVRLHVQNPALRSSLEAGCTREKKGGGAGGVPFRPLHSISIDLIDKSNQPSLVIKKV